MNKYIEADRLRAEIEIKKKTEGWCEVGKDTADIYYARGVRFTCDFVLNLIDSFQQEQPEVDLEEEIAGMYQALFGTDVINRKERLYLDTFEAIARHFAEWGIEEGERQIMENARA